MNGQQGVAIDQLSKDDLVRIVQRDQIVKRELHGRIGVLTGETIELYTVINELQEALNAANSKGAGVDNGQGSFEGT